MAIHIRSGHDRKCDQHSTVALVAKTSQAAAKLWLDFTRTSSSDMRSATQFFFPHFWTLHIYIHRFSSRSWHYECMLYHVPLAKLGSCLFSVSGDILSSKTPQPTYHSFRSRWRHLVRPLDPFTPKFHSKKYMLPTFEKCISEVVRIGSIYIFHLVGKKWKAKFFILCDVIFLVRLQGKFEIDHSWEWQG